MHPKVVDGKACDHYADRWKACAAHTDSSRFTDPHDAIVARQRAADEGVSATFQRGDAHDIDFGDRAFDVAVSLRVLMHTPQWRRCIAELCRVADRLVIVDYPSATSAASSSRLLRFPDCWTPSVASRSRVIWMNGFTRSGSLG